ncbi:MAG: multicopper oxidase domain-containing protein [Methylococcaceae bacterium]
MNKKILSYTPGCKQKHRVQGCIIEFGNFTRTTIMLLAMALSACQSTPPTQPELADSTTVENLTINMLDMSYAPSKLDVAHAGSYQVKVSNTATIPHDIVFSNGVRVNVAPGQQTSIFLDVPESGLTFSCSLPGHKEAGMVGTITVNNEDPPAPKAQTDSKEKPTISMTDYQPYDPKVLPLLPFEKHDIYLIAEEKLNMVAKGVSQQLWTYNGKVPGPVVHVRVGDTVRVHLSNPSFNKLPHSVDFHSSQAAWNDEMTSINPGEEKLYEWRADYAGVWMYHCGSNPALHHIASGMYGMVIVEPREGLPKVDHEFAIVQSEFYLGKEGHITDLHKASSHGPDYVVFNGVANQYKDHSIEVGTGKKVRMYVLNAGPNEDSSFHIVGTIFNRVIKEGMELVPENKGHYGAQAVDLAPAQGAIIEFTTAEDGLYPIVTHAFNFVGKGALGLIKSGDGDPKN